MTKAISTFILEEDNESFIVWQFAKMNDLIEPTGNSLLHIDEHIDMSTPRLKTSIFKLDDSLEKAIEVCYKELSINSYLVPALYLGVFDRVHWIKNSNPNSNKERISRKRCVRTFNDEGKKFIVYNPTKSPARNNSIFKKFVLLEDTLNSLKVINHNNLILNINLNYFACIRDPNEYLVSYIEITEDEYNQFNNDSKYHQLRYALLGNRIETKKENNKYYYVINDHEEIYADVKKPSKEEIIKSIKELISMLVNLNAKFKIISITKSKKSGYTPEDLVDFIESELLKELKSYFKLNIENIEQLTDRIGTKQTVLNE